MKMAAAKRVKNISKTLSQGRPATLEEARKLIVSRELRHIVLGSHLDKVSFNTKLAMADMAHVELDKAAGAAAAGRLFVVKYATLVDLWDVDFPVHLPPDVTTVFVPDLENNPDEALWCPLFCLSPENSFLHVVTAMPLKNREGFYWAFPGFAVNRGGIVAGCANAILKALTVAESV